MKKLLILLLILLLGLGAYFFYQNKRNKFLNETTPKFLASINKELEVLDEDKNLISLTRGSLLDVKMNKEVEIDEKIYYEAIYNDEVYYLLNDYLVDDIKEVVKEEKIYALRDQVLYQEVNKPLIATSIRQGEELEIISFNQLNSDGSVDYYKVRYNNLEAYIKANDNYVALEYHDISYDANKYLDLSGENALSVKYYPKDYDFYNSTNNKMPTSCNTLYINASKLNYIDEYLDIANRSGINSFVVDIKDTDVISYESDVIKEYSPSTNTAFVSKEFFAQQIKRLNDAGYYTIGRITVFKDPGYASDHLDKVIELNGEPYRYNSSLWPSIYQRDVWEYNVALALEAVNEFGFNEIQFDYVRLPEYVPIEADMHNEFNETSVEAITNFVRYACDVLHDANAYVSIDVFGEVAGLYITTYGQYWPAISNAADAISPMPYPDHFGMGYYGIEIPWKEPYALMYAWGTNAKRCQENTYDPGKLRTWIQVYDSIIDGTVYDTQKVKDQIKALENLGISDGYITWNGGASFEKYAYVIGAFE